MTSRPSSNSRFEVLVQATEVAFTPRPVQDRRVPSRKMIAVACALHSQRPGALDFPALDIGRGWCHPRTPLCPTCPLLGACPRLIERGDVVEGV